MMKQRAWVLAAYGNNGGNHMNYSIAKICKDIFNLETLAVSLDASIYRDNNIFGHRAEFEECTLKDFENRHQEGDIVISNPSFSSHLLGYRAKCTKIMYVQHYNTYPRLDLNFDVYVSVSNFVKGYLQYVYGINSCLISAFTEPPITSTPFEKKDDVLIVYTKGRQAHLNYFNKKIRDQLNIDNIQYLEGLVDRSTFLEKIDKAKYFLTLSIDEGFGLVSLEAMSRGLIVFGFDGFGGRDYMIKHYNCMISPYPAWEDVCSAFNMSINDKAHCNKISQNAISSANEYNQSKFTRSWIKVLQPLIR